jgi:cytochrome c-type protein NapB
MKNMLSTLAKLALAASMVWMGADLATAAADDAATASTAAVKLKGLRDGLPLNQNQAPQGTRQERDHGPSDRDFVQQPPLIPHTTQGYQITLNFNKCMDCHAWQKTKASGATKVSVTHFKTSAGQELDNISPRRYFCTQCHVPQTDAKPLVDNTFQRARGLQ